MNALRTIPRDEKPEWVELMFQIGPHSVANAPDYPLTFPLPFHLNQNVEGGFLYVVYRSQIIGYGKIGRVEPHGGSTVGGNDDPVGPGHNIILDGPLMRMPAPQAHKGFQGVRYTIARLHES